ncbi:winged helix-turn-helix transcriptional regulator [Actinacidiphila guanduensis]|uniref:Transcriptional regulator, HxlR family n=1 Tax=Actinacidiphila guanduensis TaxID=310781 RepID=A0A1G9W2S1_9ACTN|nr:helix-turn-helix domain-containing protein [Actinacidiphila guanduensis]SDM78507.1 transcriptional regulator, HxlR family [Actinacidiphila guanduensis]
MSRKAAASDPLCAIARSLDVIGERWSLLIIRDAFYGRTTFSEFRASLGISTDVLTARLNTLVEEGILERRPYRPEAGGRGSRERHAYHLTPDGRQLRPVLGALLQWGNAHRPNDYGPSSVLVDTRTDRPVRLAFVGEDGEEVDVAQVDSVLGPGYYAWRAQNPEGDS